MNIPKLQGNILDQIYPTNKYDSKVHTPVSMTVCKS